MFIYVQSLFVLYLWSFLKRDIVAKHCKYFPHFQLVSDFFKCLIAFPAFAA